MGALQLSDILGTTSMWSSKCYDENYPLSASCCLPFQIVERVKISGRLCHDGRSGQNVFLKQSL